VHKPVVYVETSVISYLTAQPSRDPIVAERQQVTKTWWARRDEYRLVTSAIVSDEISRGASVWVKKRLGAVQDCKQMVFIPEQAHEIADLLVRGGSLPSAAYDDALHVAVATLGSASYLLTWNLKHLANATIRARAEKLLRSAGLAPVIILTPAELLETTS
jgi:hypothetical protein